MGVTALLLDLDNTLIAEMETYEAAFTDAVTSLRPDLPVAELRQAVFGIATELWIASPVAEYCARLGLGSPTSLLSDFPGASDELAYLRRWSSTYRRDSWDRGLAKIGVNDSPILATELDSAFREQLPKSIKPYADALATVESLSGLYALGVATNGPADVQATKLKAAGLQGFFPIVVASSEVGFGKPDPRIFTTALVRMALSPADVLVVGDSLEKDVVGSAAAGLRCIWINRTGAPLVGEVTPALEIRSLRELAGAIKTLTG